MSEEAEAAIRGARDRLSRLDIDEAQRAALRKGITDVRVVLTVHVTGMSTPKAVERAKAEADRLWAWDGLTEPLFEAAEVEEPDCDDIEVSVLIGVTDLAPADAVRSVCAVFADRRWSQPAARTIPEHQFSYWEPTSRPSWGPFRIEVDVGPGLTPISEGQRRDMLDDQDFAHLHDILRMLDRGPTRPSRGVGRRRSSSA